LVAGLKRVGPDQVGPRWLGLTGLRQQASSGLTRSAWARLDGPAQLQRCFGPSGPLAPLTLSSLLQGGPAGQRSPTRWKLGSSCQRESGSGAAGRRSGAGSLRCGLVCVPSGMCRGVVHPRCSTEGHYELVAMRTRCRGVAGFGLQPPRRGEARQGEGMAGGRVGRARARLGYRSCPCTRPGAPGPRRRDQRGSGAAGPCGCKALAHAVWAFQSPDRRRG
jgi:hypothetical protein